MSVPSVKSMLCAAVLFAALLPAAAAFASEAYISQVPSHGLRVPLSGDEETSPVFIRQMAPGARLRPAPQPRRTHFTAAKLFVQNYGIASIGAAPAIVPLHRAPGALPSVGRGVESQVNETGNDSLPNVGRGLLNS
jgi:hypothetical protein